MEGDSFVNFEEPSTTQIQSQAVHMEDVPDQFNSTDNNLAQQSSSAITDDILFGDVKEPEAIDNSSSVDQDVLLELNTEEQEQFEVLDSAEGEDEKSLG